MVGPVRRFGRGALALGAVVCYAVGLGTPWVPPAARPLATVDGLLSATAAGAAGDPTVWTLVFVVGVPVVLLALAAPVLVPAGYRLPLFAVCAGAATLLGVVAVAAGGLVSAGLAPNLALVALGGGLLLLAGGDAVGRAGPVERPS